MPPPDAACLYSRSSEDGEARHTFVVTHAGVVHRVVLHGVHSALTFGDLLGSAALRQCRDTGCVAKMVYRGTICGPSTTLAEAGVKEGATPKMIMIAVKSSGSGSAPAPSAEYLEATPDASEILRDGIKRWTATEDNPAASTAAAAAAERASAAAAAPAPEPMPTLIAAPDAIALYDFNPQHARQMKLAAGDLLEVLRCEADDWWLVRPYGWKGEGADRASGWVPATYITTRPGWEPSKVVNQPANR